MYESGCARRVRPCGSSHARSTSSTRSPNRCGRRRHRMRRTGADPPAERLRSSCWSFAGSAGRVWRPLCGRRRDREPASGRRSGVRAGALAPRRGEPSRSASTWPPQGKSGSSSRAPSPATNSGRGPIPVSVSVFSRPLPAHPDLRALRRHCPGEISDRSRGAIATPPTMTRRGWSACTTDDVAVCAAAIVGAG